MMTRAALLLVLTAQAAAAQTPPQLQVYVTDQDSDVFVALYGAAAVELAGCTGAAQARALLHLPPTAPARETTLATLQAENAYGALPRLPCEGTAFDIDWPATTPVWADLEGTGMYYLPAPVGDGFIGVPTACAEIKAALAIRERLQLPGVLQGLAAPPDAGTPVVLDCGREVTGGQAETGVAATARWSLHRFETFLTEDSIGDTVYVARYLPAGEGAAPSYLPILRLDGVATRDLIVAGDRAATGAEDAMRDLFGVPADDPVTVLGAEAVNALREAVYADLCLTDCVGYVRAAGIFARPGVDLGLSDLPVGTTAAGFDRLGNPRLDWAYADGRGLSFTGCPRLIAALGLAEPAPGDWMDEAERALAATPRPGTVFDCRETAADTCTRRLAEGELLTQALFAGDGACAGRAALRLELPAIVQVPQALLLADLPFTSVRLVPAPGAVRSRLIVNRTRVPAGTSACILSATGVLVMVDGLTRLELQDIDLSRAIDGSTDEVVGILVRGGTLALDRVTVGGTAEGLTTVARGVSLCAADLYASVLRIEAEMLALQGVQARIMLSGDPAARSALAQARFGAVLTSDSRMRIDFTDIAAASPVVLRGAEVVGRSDTLAPLLAGASAGSGLQLERGSTARLTTSTAAGFRCAVSFVDAASSATLLLPGNDVARDNTHRACGPGTFNLIE